MAGARFDLVALGEPLLEFNQITPDDATGYRQGFGGDTSNCTIAAARLGARTAYVTRLGDDAFGRMFIDLWRREGVDVSGVGIDADAPTGIYFVTHGPNGHEFSYLRAGSAAARMRPGDLPLEVIRSTRVLHVSGISQAISANACDSVFAAIETARGGERQDLLRFKSAAQAVAARSCAGGDHRNDRAVRLVPAEPRRSDPDFRAQRAAGYPRLVPRSRRTDGRAQDGCRGLLGVDGCGERSRRRQPCQRSRRDRSRRLFRRCLHCSHRCR